MLKNRFPITDEEYKKWLNSEYEKAKDLKTFESEYLCVFVPKEEQIGIHLVDSGKKWSDLPNLPDMQKTLDVALSEPAWRPILGPRRFTGMDLADKIDMSKNNTLDLKIAQDVIDLDKKYLNKYLLKKYGNPTNNEGE